MDHSQNAAMLFDKHAEGYQSKFMNVDLYGDSFDFFCGEIKKENPEILELACGPGNITRYLLNKRPDFKILGFDLAPTMVALAKTNNPKAEFDVMDCRGIGQLTETYDSIMCGFCLPYLTMEETEQLMHDASTLTAPGGLLYLSTMEDDYSNSGIEKGSTGDEILMHYYQGDYLKEVLQKNQYAIVFEDRKTYPKGDGTDVTDVILIGRKLD